MKFGVVLFPGSNCHQDTIYAFQVIMEQEIVPIWYKDSSLPKIDGLLFPGGFSFGDTLRPGAIAGSSSIMQAASVFANNGGFVFGIGNGFQILCEAGLLPGVLLPNIHGKFICKNIHIVPDARQTHLTHYLEAGKALKIPIAHGFGRYYADSATLAQMRQRGQILFRYADEKGDISQEANPNGSVENIAGVCNAGKNVYGMMPHPERAVDDELGNMDGCMILKSIIRMV